jgi:hypothetical protein
MTGPSSGSTSASGFGFGSIGLLLSELRLDSRDDVVEAHAATRPGSRYPGIVRRLVGLKVALAIDRRAM